MFIIDYAGKRTNLDFELEDESIFNAWIDVITGDEILNVIRKKTENTKRMILVMTDIWIVTMVDIIW